MSDDPTPHDLASFIDQFNSQIQSDYEQIQRRVREDPGTAGDQVEETWANILRGWLPSHFHVRTKGRILGRDGFASPQVDIIVLWPNYPPRLLDKKLYLASGIAAAFECKLTFRKKHIKEVFENAVAISKVVEQEYQERRNLKRESGENYGYEEYHRIFEYGLLAHSFDGFGDVDPHVLISEEIERCDSELITHPRQMVDLICISDLACWASERAPYTFSFWRTGPHSGIKHHIPHPQTGYNCHVKNMWDERSSHYASFSPIGSLLARLYKKLSYTDSTLRPLSRYYSSALAVGLGGGMKRLWNGLDTPPDLWAKYQTNIKKSDVAWAFDAFLAY